MAISVVAHPGIPAYRHDWQWPIDNTFFSSWFWSKLDAWSWQGFGQPNIAIQVHPFFALSTLAAHALSSKIILTGWLTASTAVAAAGAASFVVWQFGVRPFAAIVAGVLYSLSPVVVNKMVAGHIPYLLAYAGVPWLLVASLSRHRAAPWAVGVILAWLALQIQILAFGVVLALTTTVKPLRLRCLFPVALAAGSLVPYAWAVLRPAAVSTTTAMHTSIPWEVVQSAPLSEAMLGIGYFAHYWEAAAGSTFGAPVVPWLYLAGIALALVARPNWATCRLAGSYVLGALLVSGLKGPLAGPLSWLFGHVLAASAFRELYHAAILVSFAGAVGAGIALNAIPNKLVQAAATTAIVLVTAAPWLIGTVLGQTGSAFGTAAFKRAVAVVEYVAQPSRFYIAPGANPVGPSSSRAGGADPSNFIINHAAPLWIYLARGQEGTAVWALQHGGTRAAVVARALGISTMLTQAGLMTKFASTLATGKKLRVSEFSGALPKIPGWSAPNQASSPVLPRAGVEPSILRLIPDNLAAGDISQSQNDDLLPGVHGLPIDAGWVPAADWWFLSERVAQAATQGVVTAGHDVPLPIRCADKNSSVDLYAAGQGRVGHVIVSPSSWRKLSVVCRDNARASASNGGFVVVTLGSDLAAWNSILALGRLPDASLKVRQRGDSLVATVTSDCRHCTIVLSERAAPAWWLSIGHESRMATPLPSGFSSWRVDVAKGQVIQIRYASARLAAMLEWCAAACWLWLLGGLAYYVVRSSPSPPNVI